VVDGAGLGFVDGASVVLIFLLEPELVVAPGLVVAAGLALAAVEPAVAPAVGTPGRPLLAAAGDAVGALAAGALATGAVAAEYAGRRTGIRRVRRRAWSTW
jgi:hypothetical protein